MSRLFIWLSVLSATVFILVIAAVFFFKLIVGAPSLGVSNKNIYIPPGAGLYEISQIFYQSHIINKPLLFEWVVRINSYKIPVRSGEYFIPKGASISEIIKIIQSGRTVVRRFTVPEGLTTYQIISRLKQAEGLFGQINNIPKEGELLPETYFYSFGDKRNTIIKRMKKALNEVLEKYWDSRQIGLPIKNYQELIILASIVEKETSIKEERARVAGVFVNRLRKRMRLQSDPTVIYGLTAGRKNLERRLTRKDLMESNPYNTYTFLGLPQGPIANPGKQSILAALNPVKSDELFFVADGLGGHRFSENLSEHNNNVRRWRALKKNKIDLQLWR